MTESRMLEWNGEVKNISEWASVLGINFDTIVKRINTLGWSIDKALSTPVRKKRGRRNLTQARLKELLDYGSETGVFTWRTRRRGVQKGSVAGTMGAGGYWNICIDGVIYRAHRLVWLYEHGYFPEHDIDHIDRDRINNAIRNLREASRSCNLRNSKLSDSNTSGVKGVCWHEQTGKWQVTISEHGVQRSVGVWSDFADAVCARLAAEQCLKWEGCDSTSPAYRWVLKNVQS